MTLTMKTVAVLRNLCLCLAAGWLSAAPAKAADSAAGKKPAKSSAEAAAGSELEIPLSTFVMPTSPKEGKDPFFPTSLRPYKEFIRTPRVAPTNAPVSLTINGIVPGKLVMIMGRSFSAGEEGEVPTTGGRKRIRCIRIKEDSAIIEVDGERQEVRMRGGL